MKNKYLIKSVYIPDEYQELIKELEEYSKSKKRSQSHIICEAIKKYLEEELYDMKNT